MREILVIALVFGSIPFILARPYVGVLVWSWLGYMNPHRLTFGFAYDFPFAFTVAIATLIGMVFSAERKRFPVNLLTLVWFLFVVWMCVTTLYAFQPPEALRELERVLKIQFMTFVTIILMRSRERLRLLVWVIVVSLAFFGVKGGVFTILTGGENRVWGPPGSYVEGNNEMGLALLMILPLMQFLRSTAERRWTRWLLLVSMVLCAFAVAGSQSRGAFIGGIAMVVLLWMKSRRKLVTGIALVALVPVVLAFMPEQWHDRMRTIGTYDQDESALDRINAWKLAANVANDNPLGGGFEMWTAQTFARYSPENRVPHDAHSIFFKVLGEHGWLGLALFLAIGVMAWRLARSIVLRTRGVEELRWMTDLARMIQVSFVAFAVGGAFLSLSYFDLYWHLVAIIVICGELLKERLATAPGAALEAGAPAGRTGAAALPEGVHSRRGPVARWVDP